MNKLKLIQALGNNYFPNQVVPINIFNTITTNVLHITRTNMMEFRQDVLVKEYEFFELNIFSS